MNKANKKIDKEEKIQKISENILTNTESAYIITLSKR